jgi:hypothetical protein
VCERRRGCSEALAARVAPYRCSAGLHIPATALLATAGRQCRTCSASPTRPSKSASTGRTISFDGRLAIQGNFAEPEAVTAHIRQKRSYDKH